MNVADSDLMLGLLDRGGYARTDDPARADLILINTCAVREKAEERVFARASMLGTARRGPTWSWASPAAWPSTSRTRSAERAPDVDVMVGPDGYRRLLDRVERGARAAAPSRTRALDREETYEGLDPIAVAATA